MLDSKENLKEVEFCDGLGESLILGDQEKELPSGTEFKHEMQVVFLKKRCQSVRRFMNAQVTLTDWNALCIFTRNG
jgi:hypothetical protein